MRPAAFRHAVPVVVAAGLCVGAFSLPPLPQDPEYHRLADGRRVLGIPNGLNVLSNLPIGVAGALGLLVTLRRAGRAQRFRDPWERWPYGTLFGAAILTMAGSAYYHLAPDHGRLVWDRLPMAVGFSAFLTAVAAERIGPRLGRVLFVPLLVFGAGSVGWWHWTELAGAGDLRAYGLVQFGSLVMVLVMLLVYPARYSGGGYLAAGLGLYGLALVFQATDAAIFARTGIVSGHTLKHLAGAAGIGCLAVMLVRRAPRP